MKTNLLLAAAASALLAGCASDHGYRCPMPEACAPVYDNYKAAVADDDWYGWASGDSEGSRFADKDGKDAKKDKKSKNNASSDKRALDVGELQPPGRDAGPSPIYAPPRPWQVWLAPTRRADGTLESGSYVWFTTEGHWNYLGNTWSASPLAGSGGSAAAKNDSDGDDSMLHPLAPSDLGFTPGKAAAPKGVLENIAQPDAGR
ncbi:MAG: TraV family lipoprotein [Sinobacteraceae bacterium]|nr:TraV family lipoprotein [Nevskiaceae bacterium]